MDCCHDAQELEGVNSQRTTAGGGAPAPRPTCFPPPPWSVIRLGPGSDFVIDRDGGAINGAVATSCSD